MLQMLVFGAGIIPIICPIVSSQPEAYRATKGKEELMTVNSLLTQLEKDLKKADYKNACLNEKKTIMYINENRASLESIEPNHNWLNIKKVLSIYSQKHCGYMKNNSI